MPERTDIINFGAGPSALPTSVLEEAAKGLLNYNQTGIGLTELSHRSKEFGALTKHLESLIRIQLAIPSTHSILFTQGGGSGQFSSVVLNLLARHHLLNPGASNDERVMDYVVTGSWSKKAVEEAKRLGGGKVNIVVDGRVHSRDGKSFDGIPPHEQWAFSPNPAFIYYCENETVDGVQFSHDPTSPQAFPHHLLRDRFTPLVADYSSSFMSRPIPRLADHALIYAGAQKNIGPAGLTVLIVRQDLLVDTDAAAKLGASPVPCTLAYKTLADSGSLYNTPPMFPMYVAALVLERIQDGGSVQHMEEVNRRKAEMLYAILNEGEERGIVKIKARPGSRSWMNVTFQILGEGTEQKFLEVAEARGFRQLKGHRSVGGIRVSLYNAVTEEQTKRLVDYIKEYYSTITNKS
ncbi:pyridoxal phosphate-dependent transferase [Hysterangium stoloniferum]|nr:pyridoxal phosphate-dependent transferase [Hysterangium stoloniferum]